VRGDAFEDFMEDSLDLPDGKALELHASSDPTGDKTAAFLRARIFSPDPARVKKLVQNLASPDYYVRVRAAYRILTFPIRKDVDGIIAEEALKTSDPEVLFQLRRIEYERSHNFFKHLRRVKRMRDRCLSYLASRRDPRFFSFARKVYEGGGGREKKFIIRLCAGYEGEERVKFLEEVLDGTDIEVLYPLFFEIRKDMNIPAARRLTRMLAGSSRFPPLLRAMAAAALVVHGERDIPPLGPEDAFLRTVFSRPRRAVLLDTRRVEGASGEEKKRPPDVLVTVRGEREEGWITGIDLYTGVVCDTGKGMRLIPLFQVDTIRLFPTAKRENADYAFRVVLVNGDSVAGELLEFGERGAVLKSTYLRSPVKIPRRAVAWIQVGTEFAREVPPVRKNTLRFPRLHMRNGDVLKGDFFVGRDGRLGLRPAGYTVYAGSRSRGVSALFFRRRDVKCVEFPVSSPARRGGYCTVKTMCGERLTGYLLKMDRRYCILVTEKMGTLFISRDKLKEIRISPGVRFFKELALMAFPSENAVRVYTLRGEKILELKGLHHPVFAEKLSDGSICVCEPQKERISFFSAEGVLLKRWNGFPGVKAVRELPDGGLLLSFGFSREAVMRLDREGLLQEAYPGAFYAADAAPLPDGGIVAAVRENPKLMLFAPGKKKPVFVRPLSLVPLSIQVLPGKKILVSARRSVAVYSLPRFVKQEKTDITKFSNPRGFKHGRFLYVTDGKVLYKLDAVGNVVESTELPGEPSSLRMY